MSSPRSSGTTEFDPRAFRQTLGAFATGVAVVAAEAADGTLIGMTMSSFNSVSLDPPLVLFSVARTALSLPALRMAAAYGKTIGGVLKRTSKTGVPVDVITSWGGGPLVREKALKARRYL